MFNVAIESQACGRVLICNGRALSVKNGHTRPDVYRSFDAAKQAAKEFASKQRVPFSILNAGTGKMLKRIVPGPVMTYHSSDEV